MSEWLFILRPPRDTFIDDATDEERAMMGRQFTRLRRVAVRARHPRSAQPASRRARCLGRGRFEYLVGLLEQGRLVIAGPSLSPTFGVGVIEAADEAEARAIVDADPSVRSGLQRYELSPFRVSLLRGRPVG